MPYSARILLVFLCVLGPVDVNKIGSQGKCLGKTRDLQVVHFHENFNLGGFELCLCPQNALTSTRPKIEKELRV